MPSQVFHKRFQRNLGIRARTCKLQRTDVGRLEFNQYPDSFQISGTHIFSMNDWKVAFVVNQAAPTLTFLSVLSEHRHVINV